MPTFSKKWKIDPKILDILVEKDKEEHKKHKNGEKRPYLRLPILDILKKLEYLEKTKKNEENNDGVTIIDL